MHAFPKSARVRQSSDFRRIMDGGTKTVCPSVVLFAKPRAQDGSGPRVGLVVSKKVAKEAVARNRVKRHLREAFRHVRPALAEEPAFKDVDLVVVARAQAAEQNGPEIAGALRHCLKRLGRQLAQKTDDDGRK